MLANWNRNSSIETILVEIRRCVSYLSLPTVIIRGFLSFCLARWRPLIIANSHNLPRARRSKVPKPPPPPPRSLSLLSSVPSPLSLTRIDNFVFPQGPQICSHRVVYVCVGAWACECVYVCVRACASSDDSCACACACVHACVVR